MKTFLLITNISGQKYWSFLCTAKDTTDYFHLKVIAKHGNIYVNDKGGYFTKDCIGTIHEVVNQKTFPKEV